MFKNSVFTSHFTVFVCFLTVSYLIYIKFGFGLRHEIFPQWVSCPDFTEKLQLLFYPVLDLKF